MTSALSLRATRALVRRRSSCVSLDLVARDTTLWVIAVAFVSASPPTRVAGGEGKCLAIYAPRPEYPSLPNGRRPEGKGIFIWHIDAKTGRVTSASIDRKEHWVYDTR